MLGCSCCFLKAEVFLSVFVALDWELVHARLARGSFFRTTNQPWDKKNVTGLGSGGERERES